MATLASVLGARLKRNWAGTVTSSTWTDAAGVSNATQATSARQPTVVTTPANQNVLSFSSDGSFGTNADVMVAPAGGASATPNYTLACGICKVEPGFGNDGNGCVLFQIGTGGAGGIVYIYPALSNALRAAGYGSTAFAYGSAAINDGVFHTWTAQWNVSARTVELWIDGQPQGADPPPGSANNIDLSSMPCLFGATDASGTAVYQGKLGCVAVAQDASAFTSDIAAIHASLLEWIQAKLTADAAAFTLTGQQANLHRGYRMVAATGTFALTGSAAGLRADRRLTASSGALSVTAPAAGLRVARQLSAASGAFTLAAPDTSLRVARRLVAAPATFTLTGNDVAFPSGMRLVAEAAAFTLTGSAAGLRASRRLIAESQTFTFEGNDATLTHEQAGAYTLNAESASFALTAADVELRRDARLPTDAGTFSISGAAAELRRGVSMPATPASFTMSGSEAQFLRGRRLSAATGAFALTGNPVNLVAPNIFSTSTVAYYNRYKALWDEFLYRRRRR